MGDLVIPGILVIFFSSNAHFYPLAPALRIFAGPVSQKPSDSNYHALP